MPAKSSSKKVGAKPKGDKRTKLIKRHRELVRQLKGLCVSFESFRPTGQREVISAANRLAGLDEAKLSVQVGVLEMVLANVEELFADNVRRFGVLSKKLRKYNIPLSQKEFESYMLESQQEELEELGQRVESIEKSVSKIKAIYKYYMNESGVSHTRGVSISGSQAILPISNSGVLGKVQEIGQRYGCWECGEKIEDKNSWIADHIPPFNLKKSKVLFAAAYFGVRMPTGFTLYPSCKRCSNYQSALVRAMNSTRNIGEYDFDADDKYYLFGGRKKANGVSVSSRATAAARTAWAGMTDLVCHICGAKQSHRDDDSYVADHFPPREFNTNYATTLFEMVGLRIIDPEVRPQCPSCSGSQGGRLSNDSRQLLSYAELFGITQYKR